MKKQDSLTSRRPLSPHLQIYKWQLTMSMSILHRVTGAGLAVGTVLFTVWLLAALGGEASFSAFHNFHSSFIGQLMLFGWLFSFVYHFMNGIRHLVWDAGYGLSLKDSYRSGWAVVGVSVLATLLIWGQV